MADYVTSRTFPAFLPLADVPNGSMLDVIGTNSSMGTVFCQVATPGHPTWQAEIAMGYLYDPTYCWPLAVPVTRSNNISDWNISVDLNTTQSIRSKCECGASSVGSDSHSDYCPIGGLNIDWSKVVTKVPGII